MSSSPNSGATDAGNATLAGAGDEHLAHIDVDTALVNLADALDRSLPVPLGTQLRGLIEFGIALGELPAGQSCPRCESLLSVLVSRP